MADINVPVQTAWDIIASAFNEPYFWLLYVGGVLTIALLFRYRIKKSRGCS